MEQPGDPGRFVPAHVPKHLQDFWCRGHVLQQYRELFVSVLHLLA